MNTLRQRTDRARFERNKPWSFWMLMHDPAIGTIGENQTHSRALASVFSSRFLLFPFNQSKLYTPPICFVDFHVIRG
jgi:hypothetical protein